MSKLNFAKTIWWWQFECKDGWTPDSISKLGWEFKSIHKEKLFKICTGSLISWCKPFCEVILPQFFTSDIFIVLIAGLSIKSPRPTIKACVRYFLSNFYFLSKWYPFKNYEKCFLFHLKSSFQIFVFFPFLSTLSRFKRINGSGIIYDVINDLHKFADAIFGITKNLFITSSNLVR